MRDRILCLLPILLLLCLTACGGAGGEPLTAAAKEEIVYASLSADGEVEGVTVVNLFAPGVDGVVEDFGDYTAVRRMTGEGTLRRIGDAVWGRTSGGRFAYEGVRGDLTLPWRIGLTYTLDGAALPAAELAGGNGELRIILTVTRDHDCAGTYYECCALRITVPLDEAKCRDISAPGAEITRENGAAVLRCTVLPGRDAELVIEAQVADFAMAPITIEAAPPELGSAAENAALEKLAAGAEAVGESAAALAEDGGALSGRADTFRDDTSELFTSAGTVSGSSVDIRTDLNALKRRLDGVESGGAPLNDSAYSTFEGFCRIVETAVNGELTAYGLPAVTLTPENYGRTLDELARTLSAASIFSVYLADYAEQLRDIRTQMDEYAAFCDTLRGYTEDVTAAASGVPGWTDALMELERGTGALRFAAAVAGQHAAALQDALDAQQETAAALGDAANSVVSGVEALLDSLEPLPPPGSFASEKNGNVASVRFVLQTAEIALREPSAVQSFLRLLGR